MIDIEKFDRQLNPRHKDYGKYKIADQKDAMKTLLADLYHELGAKKDTVQAIITPPYSKIAINDVAFKWTRRCVRRILPLEVSTRTARRLSAYRERFTSRRE